MALNVHNIVRGAINAINPDISAVYLASRGYTVAADGSQVPIYCYPQSVTIQVQPPSTRDLEHINFLNLQGVIRTVFLYGNPNGVDRVIAQGGDLLLFPQRQPSPVFDGNGQIVTDGTGAPVMSAVPFDNWLVTAVDEWWDVGAYTGWTKLFVTLQTDGRQIVFDGGGLPILDGSGALVTSQ